jgi:hydrogenase small subunit
MTPFYHTLPNAGGFGIESTADEIGIGIVATVAGLTVAHAIGSTVKMQKEKKREREQPATSGEAAQGVNLAEANKAVWKWPTEATEE